MCKRGINLNLNLLYEYVIEIYGIKAINFVSNSKATKEFHLRVGKLSLISFLLKLTVGTKAD